MNNLKQIITNFLIVYFLLDVARMYFRRLYVWNTHRKFLKELHEAIKVEREAPDYDTALRMITCNDKDCGCTKE